MRYEDQKILVAIGLEKRGVVMGYRGEVVYAACSLGWYE